ncbi:MAG: DEAD/DEAH box helicase [Nitrosotalea sp.]
MNATIPEFNWSYLESIIVRNATTLSFMIESMAYSNPELLKNIGQSTLRLALLWENLARLKENTEPKKALMNASIAYEIAGYQANASCLARRVSQNQEDKLNSLENISSLFLQRLFLNLKRHCEVIRKEPEHYENEYDAVKHLALAISAEGFLQTCNYFLNGSLESISKAEQHLSNAENLFSKIASFDESNIIRSIRSLLPIMQNRSTWNLLGSVVESPVWERYLKLLARGIGTDLIDSPSISELWPSQIGALKDGLLTDVSNKIVKMPTSAGKTRIAEMAIVHTLVNNSNAKCVYVAPYRALVAELEDTFLNIFGDLGFKISTISGTYEMDPFEERLAVDADILVITPEKLDLLFRSNSEFLNNVRLFILDEGHIINEKSRGIKFELLLTRLKRKLSNARFLFLSAVLSSDTITEFLRWFNAGQNGFIKSDWRPSLQRYARFEWTAKKNGVIRYAPSNENKLLDTFVPGIISQIKYKFLNPETGRMNSETFPTSSKAQTAAELAFKFADLGPVLVFSTHVRWVDAVANALQLRINLTRRTETALPHYFQNNKSRSATISSELLGNDHQITKLLVDGIAIHHADLPDILRRAIEVDFRERRFRVIVATSTLAQGVNLPIRTVIFHSCRRYVEDELVPISISDYWNIAGRAGRAGQETEGTVIHLVNTPQDKADYFHYLNNRESLEPAQGALFKLLLRLVNESISDEETRKLLDPEILALLAEENGLEILEGKLKEILDNSLVSEQAIRNKTNTSSLYSAFEKVAKIIVKEIPDEKKWKTYSITGLSATSCQIIQKYIEQNLEIILNLINDKSFQNIPDLLQIILEVLNELSEMEVHNDYSGDYHELLLKWISGKSISEILTELKIGEPIKIVKFVEEYFGYLLPWGISGFIQIAKHVLGFDDEGIPIHIKYLPSMVKFGVPTPESSWAMMIGIPFKKTAIMMASRYSSQSTAPSYEDFRNWISNVESEELRHEYGLESPFLEDVSKALFRAGINPLLNNEHNIKTVITMPTRVRGISYESRNLVAYTAKKGDPIQLTRDYDNRYDRNAIRVYLHGKELGFLNRNLAQFLAPYIDCGLNLGAEIVEVISKTTPQIKIKINEK